MGAYRVFWLTQQHAPPSMAHCVIRPTWMVEVQIMHRYTDVTY